MGKLFKQIRKGVTSDAFTDKRALEGSLAAHYARKQSKEERQEVADKLHPIGTQSIEAYDQANAAKAAAASAETEPVIPLPDEEALTRARRRMARRNTGRASTVLTDQERFGV